MDMKRKPVFDCPVNATLHVIGKRVLAQQLRQLERDGIVARRVYDQSPPRVEYSLTDFGRTLEPVMERLCEWGETYAAHFAGSN